MAPRYDHASCITYSFNPTPLRRLSTRLSSACLGLTPASWWEYNQNSTSSVGINAVVHALIHFCVYSSPWWKMTPCAVWGGMWCSTILPTMGRGQKTREIRPISLSYGQNTCIPLQFWPSIPSVLRLQILIWHFHGQWVKVRDAQKQVIALSVYFSCFYGGPYRILLLLSSSLLF